MKLAEFLTLAAIAVLLAMGLVIHACNSLDHREEEKVREWREFSETHHCVVTDKPTFWNNTSIWKCDGFDVRKYNNE